MEKTYTLTDDTLNDIYAQIQRQTRVTGIVLAVLGALSVPVVLWLGYATLLPMLAIMAGYFAFILAAGWYYGKVQRERWQLYAITLTDEDITREEGGRNTITIHKGDITTLYDIPDGGGILIKTERRRKYIHIAPEVDGFDEIRQRLAAWRDFDPVPETT
jgi:hypothetical protein